jgi:hypothetical protein
MTFPGYGPLSLESHNSQNNNSSGIGSSESWSEAREFECSLPSVEFSSFE